MKYYPLFFFVSLSFYAIAVNAGETNVIGNTSSYLGTTAKEAAGDIADRAGEVGYNVSRATQGFMKSPIDFVSDIYDGSQKRLAMTNGDGVALNARVYSMALRQAEKDNTVLKEMTAQREKRAHNRERLAKESDRLTSLAGDYKNIASDLQRDMSQTLWDIGFNAKKLRSWSDKEKAIFDEFLESHKQLGKLTAKDGNARAGEHLVLSMKGMLANLDNAIRSSPDSAEKRVLVGKMKMISTVLSGAQNRINDKEAEIQATMQKVNELAQFDEAGAQKTEQDIQRAMILGTLNNSVGNLITQGEFSKMRSQLAFSHFGDIEKQMKDKGVQAGDVKASYRLNSKQLAEQYNNTPLGVYVNEQIAKAMGSVCDMIANQCSEGMNKDFFEFLDDSNRTNFGKRGSPLGTLPTNLPAGILEIK